MNRPPEIRTHHVYVTDVHVATVYQSLDTCGACVLIVWMFVQLSVCIIKCISLSLSLSVQPTLQMIELLSMSASVCYLWVFMIYCANSVNASTWRLLLSDNWTRTGCTNTPDCFQWLFDSIMQRWSRIWLTSAKTGQRLCVHARIKDGERKVPVPSIKSLLTLIFPE